MQSRRKRFFVLGMIAVLSACSGDSGPDTYTCPSWKVNDAMSYAYTLTVGGWSNAVSWDWNMVVTGRTASRVTMQSQNETRTISIENGLYVTDPTLVSAPDVLGAGNNQFCPPPAKGTVFTNWSFTPGQWEGSGEYFERAWEVVDITAESVSVPAGDFTAAKISLIPADPADLPRATLTRYYVGKIGVVKEIEVHPSENVTHVGEMVSYSYQ